MARPSYPQEMATELALRTSCLIGEITERSGKKPAELEKFFKVGTNANGKAERFEAGKQWRKWKNGERCLEIENEQKIKYQALKLGWLPPEWILDAIITNDNYYHYSLKKKAAQKITRHLKELVKILSLERREKADLRQLGELLANLYIVNCHACQESFGEPSPSAESALATLEQSRTNCSLQFGEEQARKIEKYLTKTMKILALEIYGTEEDLKCLCHRIGDRLIELYAGKA